MRIFVLMENTARPGSGCASEHGLSLLLEYEGHRLLFDTGASPLFLRNASLLGVDAERVEAAALSHGHYDHGGGLPAYLMRGEAPVYVQASAFMRRGSLRQNGEMAEIGLDPGLRGAPRLRLLTGNREILPGALLFADVGRELPLPAANAVLFREEGGALVPDDFRDEQHLLLRAEGKAVLVTGCAHRGIGNIVRRARELAGLCAFIAFDRPGVEAPARPFDPRLLAHRLRGPMLGLSSTAIREAVANGAAMRYPIGDLEARYLRAKALYQGKTDEADH